MKNLNILAIVAAVSGAALSASAQVTAVDIGTANPPATLGGYTMVPYVPAAITGTEETSVGVGWATWGQGYTGTVFFDLGTTIDLTLSGKTSAVDFYEEPNLFETFDMTATDSSGASVTQSINGYAGSAGVGFYEDTAGVYLSSITVTVTSAAEGEAIGEFGVNQGGIITGHTGVPDTASTLALLGLSAVGLFVYNRRVATV